MNHSEYIENFKKITEQMVTTTAAKNKDYCGGVDDAFKNFKVVETLGLISAEAGILVRMTDKLSRMAGFVETGILEVKDEKIEDTAIDLAVYSIIFALVVKSKKKDWIDTDIARDYTQPTITGPYNEL